MTSNEACGAGDEYSHTMSVDDSETKNFVQGILLWDIDGTLVQKKKSPQYSRHLSALGLPQLDIRYTESELSGLSDWDVLSIYAKRNGLAKEMVMRAFKMLNEYVEVKSRTELQPVRQVENILAQVNLKGWINGILTGNTLVSAKVKLKEAKLLDFFDSSMFFCCQVEESRIDIARRAKNLLWKEESRVIIIGDTVHDVYAAKENRLKVISVPNTSQNLDGILKLGPDKVIESLDMGPERFFTVLEEVINKKN